MDGMLSVFTEKHKGVAGSALHLDGQLVMVLEIVTQVLDWFEEGNYMHKWDIDGFSNYRGMRFWNSM